MVYLTGLSEAHASFIQLRVKKWFINNELESMWKEAIVSQIRVLSWHLCGGTEGNHENLQSRSLVSGLKFQFWVSRISSKNANSTERMFFFCS
jgi:hypothetical protein